MSQPSEYIELYCHHSMSIFSRQDQSSTKLGYPLNEILLSSDQEDCTTHGIHFLNRQEARSVQTFRRSCGNIGHLNAGIQPDSPLYGEITPLHVHRLDQGNLDLAGKFLRSQTVYNAIVADRCFQGT